MNRFRIQLIATGGTLAKTYEPHSGNLIVDNAAVDTILAALTLPDFDIEITHLMARDSLDMEDSDRQTILDATRARTNLADAIVITHGTDTLCQTSTLLASRLPDVNIPVVLTGAMVPDSCHGSDARQNVAQAIAACRLLPAGVHIVFHGCHLDGASAVKNHETLTFEPIA